MLKQSHVDAAKDKADKGCSALSLDFKKLATETLQDYGLKLAPGAICNAAVGGFRHARQRGVVDAKDIDLEQRQVDDNRTKALLAAAESEHTSLFFESPHRLTSTLEILSKEIPDHQICVARELTKKFETYHRGTSKELYEHFSVHKPKGEIVLLLMPKPGISPY